MKYIIIGVFVFFAGHFLGSYRAESAIISKLDTFHRATLLEDGRWHVVDKQGNVTTGCIATGVCND